MRHGQGDADFGLMPIQRRLVSSGKTAAADPDFVGKVARGGRNA